MADVSLQLLAQQAAQIAEQAAQIKLLSADRQGSARAAPGPAGRVQLGEDAEANFRSALAGWPVRPKPEALHVDWSGMFPGGYGLVVVTQTTEWRVALKHHFPVRMSEATGIRIARSWIGDDVPIYNDHELTCQTQRAVSAAQPSTAPAGGCPGEARLATLGAC